MDIAVKISALEEYCTRQQQKNSNLEAAAHAAGMVAGLKYTLDPGFDYDEAIVEASIELQTILANKNASLVEIERATGFFSGIVFSEIHDIAEAQGMGYREREALIRLQDNETAQAV
jgi:hypothetical protein